MRFIRRARRHHLNEPHIVGESQLLLGNVGDRSHLSRRRLVNHRRRLLAGIVDPLQRGLQLRVLQIELPPARAAQQQIVESLLVRLSDHAFDELNDQFLDQFQVFAVIC